MTDALQRYLELWHLSDPVWLAQTPTSTVYAVRQDGDKVVLKLLTPVGFEDEYEGIAALRYFDGQGAVRVLLFDEGAILMEYAGDEQLAERVWRGDDLNAAAIIADVLNQLHRPQPEKPTPGLRSLRRRFRALFERAQRDQAAGDASIYVRGARMAEHLLATEQDQCVLHGDMHHHNVRLHPTRGWLAFDPKGLYGERTYDAANTVCNPSNARERVLSEARMLDVTQVLADGMGIDVGRLRAFVFAYCCLSAAWFGDVENDVKFQIITVAANAERHVGRMA